jgi:hypothetical protein
LRKLAPASPDQVRGSRGPPSAPHVLARPFHRSSGGSPFPPFCEVGFPVSVLLVRMQAKGWRRLLRWTALRHPFSRRVRPRASTWRIPRRSSRLPRAREPRSRGQTERNCAGRREKASAFFSPIAFRAYSTDGRQPFLSRGVCNASLFRACSLGSPFSRRSSVSSAHLGAPSSSDCGNIT